MAKLSISLPDELSDSLQSEARMSGNSVSAVIRQALEATGHGRVAGAVDLPEDPRFEAATARLLDEGKALYVQGYADGLYVAAGLPWEAFEQLDAANFDIARWLDGIADIAESTGRPLDHQVYDLLPLTAGIGTEIRPEIETQGFVTALRDTWTQVLDQFPAAKLRPRRQDWRGLPRSPQAAPASDDELRDDDDAPREGRSADGEQREA
jgi:hypothetical protein